MLNYFEIIRRALTGPYYTEEEFDLQVLVPKLREVVKKYGIRYDPENPIPSDEKLADDVFRAALEFYTDVGTYCVDTGRVIRFTKEEIQGGLKAAPAAPVFGEGRDEKAMVARKPESNIPPWCFVGAGGGIVSSEEMYVRLVEGYGRNPLVNSITAPTLTTINGMEIRAGSPLELLACIRSVGLAREALRWAQRPGLPIMNSIATAVTDTAKIGGSQFGLRPSDGWLIGSMAEMKITFQRMNEIAYVLARGGHVVAETSPVMGGYCGGPSGVAVANAAYHLQCILVMRGSCQLTFPIHFNYSCNTGRDLLWAVSVSSQAISRNSHMPVLDLTYTAAGPMTDMCLYEIAAAVMTSVVSGASIEFGGVAKATKVDYLTPMEPKFASEVAHATPGMSREECNEIVKKLLPKYEDRLADPPPGKKFQECYNLDSIEPCQEYIDLYSRIKEELTGYGLKFK